MKKNKYGFTLAEAMITLVIIGIISAIVIPSVITRFEIRTRETTANKARYDVAMAAGLVASQHLRWRDLSINTNAGGERTLIRAFRNTGLNDSDSISYTYNTNLDNGRLVIGADVDGDGAADVVFYATRSGAIEDDNACTVAAYKERKTAANNTCRNKATKSLSEY